MRSLWSLIILLLTFSLQAQEEELFETASQYYAEENYTAAIKNYEQILAAGKVSAEVYFNLANAYYKTDSLAPSIYFYNKALQLAPYDEDIKNNLSFAEERIIDVIEETPKMGWAKISDNVINVFTVNTWAVLAIMASFALLLFGVLYYFYRSPFKKRLCFGLALFSVSAAVLSVVFAFVQGNEQQNRRYAIVFDKAVEVHAEPNHNSETIYELHEGTKLKILDSFNGYTHIRLADGKRGWLKEDAVKAL